MLACMMNLGLYECNTGAGNQSSTVNNCLVSSSDPVILHSRAELPYSPSTEGYKPSCDDVRFDAGSYMLQGDKTASLGYKLGLDSLPSYFNNKNLEIEGELAEFNGQILI